MSTTTEFRINDATLRDMAALGKRMLDSARVYEGMFGKIIDRMRKAQQIEDYMCVEFLKAYRLIQTHNAAHDREAGKRIAEEVKLWQRARVRVPYKDEPQPLLDCTEAITVKINEVHAWFD